MPSSSNKPLVLITGANQGLGYATAKILVDSGEYHVILACRSLAKGIEAINQLKSENPNVDTKALTPLVVDITDDASITAAKDTVENEFGHLNILINSAAVNGQIPIRKPGLRENYQIIFDTNVFGVAIMTQTFLPLLRASTYADRRIVNVTSGLGQIGVALAEDSTYYATNFPAPEYRSSKAALNMITAVDAVQLKSEGIHVILVAPGYTATGLNAYSGRKTPSEGAVPIVRAATDGSGAQMTGKLHAEELLEYGW
ncbi:hypothetical protein E0Z10_g8079 [Xylaria hypoxylon]|uniref:Uncharacterized protein n=1 Tax=Xylaria hypoxylon TaxID=37992 RepID=A0A4Z0YCB3_9PEZI|nr:hypothetical protein E0Z10_g8079 [Xylaria hypoxylon]